MGRRAGFPFWDLGTWERKETFAGVLTAGRIAKVAFDKAGIPAHVVYHNHANHVPPPPPSLPLLSNFHLLWTWGLRAAELPRVAGTPGCAPSLCKVCRCGSDHLQICDCNVRFGAGRDHQPFPGPREKMRGGHLFEN